MGDDQCRLKQLFPIYHPDIVAHWDTEDAEIDRTDAVSQGRWLPLVWKEVEIPAGSDVRLQCGGGYRTARVTGGKIVDYDGRFIPSK